MLGAMNRLFCRAVFLSGWGRRLETVCLVGALVIGFVATPAFGADLEAKEKAARAACLTGDYAKGAALLSGLFIATKDPTWIFNLARCAEQCSKYQEAIAHFKEYLRVAKRLTGEEKADVQKHIADCQESLSVQTPSPTSPVVAQPAPLVTAQPKAASDSIPADTQPRADVSVAGGDTSAANRGSGLRVAGIVVASVGLATAVTGLVLNLKANSLADDFNRTQDPATKSSSSSYKTGSMICYGAGAGALVAAGVLYLIGRSGGGSESNSQVSFLPALIPTGFSLDVRRPF
jgi:hypothetical protein